MLFITRKVFTPAGDANCLVLDLPTGERIRLWVLPNRADSRGSISLAVDAPADVRVLRGELLPPLETQPDTQLKERA